MKSDWKHKVYPNGSIYLGDLDCMGQRHGKGIYLFDSEDLYFGDWNNNAISGHGIYIFRSG